MIKNKKAIAFGIEGFMALIIVLVVAILLFLYVRNLDSVSRSTCQLERAVCKSSVLQQALVLIVSPDIINIQCPTYHIKFFDNHVERNFRTVSVYDKESGRSVKKFKHLTDDIVNQVVAREVECCWYQFLEGKENLFNLKNFWPSDSSLNCFLCSEIAFDESVTQDEFKDFYEYTKNNEMVNSEMTYYEYFAEEYRLYSPFYDKDAGRNAWEEYADGKGTEVYISPKCKEFGESFFETRKPITRYITFNTSKSYAVFFAKEGATSKIRKLKTTPPEGCSPETYFTYVIPTNELSRQCDSLKRGPLE